MQKSHAVNQRVVQNERCKHAAVSLYPLLCEWMYANFVSNAFVLVERVSMHMTLIRNTHTHQHTHTHVCVCVCTHTANPSASPSEDKHSHRTWPKALLRSILRLEPSVKTVRYCSRMVAMRACSLAASFDFRSIISACSFTSLAKLRTR